MCALNQGKLKELEPVFYPKSIAIVGTSQDKHKAGYQYVDGLVSTGFEGKIYPVNTRGGELLGLRVYPTLSAIPGPVDYVIVSIPRQSVLPLLDKCAAKGVKAAQFFTAGFTEANDDIGQNLEREMVEKARQGGFHIIGPNCIGVYCPESRISLGSWVALSKAGSVSFLSQSGGMAISIVEMGLARGIEFSKGVSFGNGSDLDSIDFLEYFAVDPKTEVIGAYLEGVKNGRQFLETVREVTRSKPVIVLKGGRTGAGAAASIFHTGALATPSDIWAGAVKQAGIISVNSLEELTDTMFLFQQLGSWESDGVAILSGLPGAAGGGIAVSSADTLMESGLKTPSLSPETRKSLTKLLGYIGTILFNPVDISQAGGNPRTIRKVMELILADSNIGLVVSYVDVDLFLRFWSWEHIMGIMQVFIDLRRNQNKPIVVVSPYGCAMSERAKVEQTLCRAKIPVFPTLGRAAKALVNMRDYCLFRRRSHKN